MKINEIVQESKSSAPYGKLNRHHLAAMSPAHIFGWTKDKTYDLNRAMMAVAGANADGVGDNPPDVEGWNGRSNSCHPYTKEEMAMMNHVLKYLGVDVEPTVHDGSHEPEEINRSSPIKGFKGYAR